MNDSLKKYVFIQDDPFYLPKVLDKYLREFYDSTAGVNVQPVTQGQRTMFQTARELLRIYGPSYFLWKLRRMMVLKLKERLFNDWLRQRRTCYSVDAVAAKYGVPCHRTDNVNAESFRRMLRQLGVELIVSISGTQFYGRQLREQTRMGIINCHGALLPRYRGLMPSFWTLANNERVGGVTVHFVDNQLDNGPIVVQRRYRIHPQDTLEEIMARSKDLAAEAIIDAVRSIESGDYALTENRAEQATHYSLPSRDDVRRFYRLGHRFV
jgi:methionyl-tRNA formyltransferase